MFHTYFTIVASFHIIQSIMPNPPFCFNLQIVSHAIKGVLFATYLLSHKRFRHIAVSFFKAALGRMKIDEQYGCTCKGTELIN